MKRIISIIIIILLAGTAGATTVKSIEAWSGLSGQDIPLNGDLIGATATVDIDTLDADDATITNATITNLYSSHALISASEITDVSRLTAVQLIVTSSSGGTTYVSQIEEATVTSATVEGRLKVEQNAEIDGVLEFNATTSRMIVRFN